MRPTKTQVSQRIQVAWLVVVVRLKEHCILCYQKSFQLIIWSDCTNVQADLNLRWVHMSEGTFSDVEAYIANESIGQPAPSLKLS